MAEMAEVRRLAERHLAALRAAILHPMAFASIERAHEHARNEAQKNGAEAVRCPQDADLCARFAREWREEAEAIERLVALVAPERSLAWRVRELKRRIAAGGPDADVAQGLLDAMRDELRARGGGDE